MKRREFLAMSGAVAWAVTLPEGLLGEGEQTMYGLIGKLLSAPGKRDELIAILMENATKMPGCLSYIVARDSADANAVWVTEVWESQESHKASLSLPSVQQAITRAKPIIGGFGERFVTEPVGGQGISKRSPG